MNVNCWFFPWAGQSFTPAILASAPLSHRTRIGRYVVDVEEITGRMPDLRRAVAIYRLEAGLIAHVRFLRED